MLVVEDLIDLAQINVLVEGAVVRIGPRGQIIHGSRLKSIDRRGQSDENRISRVVPLSVVVEEEEGAVFDDGTTQVSAKLVEVVPRLERHRTPRSHRRRSL